MNIYKTSDEFAFNTLQPCFYGFSPDSICPLKISVRALAATVCSIATDVLLLGGIVKAAQGLRVLREHGLSAENAHFALSYASKSIKITILKTISCFAAIILPNLIVHTYSVGYYLEGIHRDNEAALLERLDRHVDAIPETLNPQPARNIPILNPQPVQPNIVPDVRPAQPILQENNLNQQQPYMLRYVDKLHREWLSIIEDGVYDNDEREGTAKPTREAIELLMGIVYQGTCNNALFKTVMELAQANQHVQLGTHAQAIVTAHNNLPKEVQDRLQWHLFNDEEFLTTFGKLPSQGEQEEHKALINIIKENLFHIHKNVINPALRDNTDNCYTEFTKKLDEITKTSAN